MCWKPSACKNKMIPIVIFLLSVYRLKSFERLQKRLSINLTPRLLG